MSSQAHCFDTYFSIPGYTNQFWIQIRYWGPQSSNRTEFEDIPAGDELWEAFQKGCLDIYGIYGLADWTDQDLNSGTYCQDLYKYIYENEQYIIAITIGLYHQPFNAILNSPNFNYNDLRPYHIPWYFDT